MGIDPVTATIGAGVLGAGAQLYGSSKAASAQKNAAQSANDTQMQMFRQIQQNLQPYMNTGGAANNALMQLTGIGGYAPGGGGSNTANGFTKITGDEYSKITGGKGGIQGAYNVPVAGSSTGDDIYVPTGAIPAGFRSSYDTSSTEAPNPLASPLLKPIAMDQASLEQTPGYQFNKAQGLKGVQNSASARGLGVSGAAQKGAATYATGLADSTYQNQFANAVTNQTNQFNRLNTLAQQGQNAAAGVVNMGTQTASNIGNNLVGIGNAQAGSYMNSANAIGNAGNSIANSLLTNKLLAGMYGDQSGTGAFLDNFSA